MFDDDALTTLTNWLHPAFHRDAGCREHPELNWFPRRGADVSRQRAICSACLVLDECREQSVSRVEFSGFWAGTTTSERKAARDVLRLGADRGHDAAA